MNGLSIIIPAYNEEKYLPATIAALRESESCLRAKHAVDVEIVVVDNLSTDRTVEVATALGARVLRCETRNIAAVRNTGIRDAKFDLVFTIDADCSLSENGLLKIYETMQTGAFVGGTVHLKMLSDRRLIQFVTFVIQAVVSRVAGINGAIFFFRRDDALTIGGFSEVRLIAEDTVFARALTAHGRTSGRKFAFLKDVIVTTTDRKNSTLRDLLPIIPHAIRSFHGRKVSIEDLKYWYDPKR